MLMVLPPARLLYVPGNFQPEYPQEFQQANTAQCCLKFEKKYKIKREKKYKP